MVKKEAWHAFSGEEVQRADRKCERAAAYLSTALTRFMATALRAVSNAARKEAFSLFFFFFEEARARAANIGIPTRVVFANYLGPRIYGFLLDAVSATCID